MNKSNGFKREEKRLRKNAVQVAIVLLATGGTAFAELHKKSG